jgi:hypothetical protein
MRPSLLLLALLIAACTSSKPSDESHRPADLSARGPNDLSARGPNDLGVPGLPEDLALQADLATLPDLSPAVDIAFPVATWSWQGASLVDETRQCYQDNALGEFRTFALWGGAPPASSLLETFFSSAPSAGSYACIDDDGIGAVMPGQVKVFLSQRTSSALTEYHCTGGTVEVSGSGASIVITFSSLPMRIRSAATVTDTLTGTVPCP